MNETKETVFGTLEVLARLTDTKIETRDIVDKWLLLTYDLPHTVDGDKARRNFLTAAYLMGATKHTESVYLLPWTPEAELLALELAQVGHAVVWTSSTTDKTKAREITRKYDAGIQPVLGKIEDRVDKTIDYLRHRKFKQADRLAPKTWKMINAIEQAIIRRGSKELLVYLETLKKRLEYQPDY